MHHPRGTDIPGQGGVLESLVIKIQPVCTIPGGRDIPGQGGGVSGCPAGKFNPYYP